MDLPAEAGEERCVVRAFVHVGEELGRSRIVGQVRSRTGDLNRRIGIGVRIVRFMAQQVDLDDGHVFEGSDRRRSNDGVHLDRLDRATRRSSRHRHVLVVDARVERSLDAVATLGNDIEARVGTDVPDIGIDVIGAPFDDSVDRAHEDPVRGVPDIADVVVVEAADLLDAPLGQVLEHRHFLGAVDAPHRYGDGRDGENDGDQQDHGRGHGLDDREAGLAIVKPRH